MILSLIDSKSLTLIAFISNGQVLNHPFFHPSIHPSIHSLGSNTHNNGAPGGDGQTGDAGEGTGG